MWIAFRHQTNSLWRAPYYSPRAEHLEQGRAGWTGVGKMKAVEVARKDIICFRLQDLLRLLSPISCWLDRRSANPADSIPINKNRAISCNGRCIFLNNCKKMQIVNSLKNFHSFQGFPRLSIEYNFIQDEICGTNSLYWIVAVWMVYGDGLLT